MNRGADGEQEVEGASPSLRELTDRQAPILQQLSEGVIIADLEGRLVFVNEAAERLHGVKKLDVAPDAYGESYGLFTLAGEPYPSDELPLARAVMKGETVRDAQWRIRRPDGSELVAVGSARPLIEEGRQIGAVLTVRDDTERHAAENALREQEERFRLVIDGASDYAIFTTDPDRLVTSWSKGAELAFGYASDEIIGRCADILWVSEDQAREQPVREVETARQTGCANDERWHQRKDGSRVFMNGSVHPLPPNEDGSERGFVKIAQDESDKRAAEDALRESEEQVRLVLDSAAGAFYAVDREGHTTLVSRGFLQMIGFKDEGEALGRKLHDLVHYSHPDGSHYPVEQCPIYRCASTGEPARVAEELFFRLDGSPVPVEYWVSPIMRDGERVGATCTIVDLTQRKAAQSALGESEARFRNMADHAPMMMWVTESDGSCSYLNRRWYEFTGQSKEEALGFGWLDAVHPDDRGWSGETFLKANSQRESFRLEYRLLRRDGVYRWAIDAGSPRFAPDGAFLGYIGSVIDIDERREMEDALRERSAEFEALAENVSQLAWMAEPDGSIFWYNKRWYDYTGTDLESMRDWGWREVHHPDLIDGVIEEVAANWAAGDAWEGTYLLRSAEGEYRWFLTRAEPIRDDKGKLIRWFGTNTDITGQLRAEEALKLLNESLETRVEEEVARRREVEEALRQSQKMETLGQLTGGIAHDFNNLLQIITGNLDIIQRGLPEDSTRLRRSAHNAAKGADRAAVLTQRLLAFSRRQPLAPKVIDANKLVSGMSEMLFRSLGETVELETVLASGLWRVEVDPNQLESAILNLAVNGRDAMEGGGKLTIETANTHLDHAYTAHHAGLAPGQYVVICVSDSGAGMDPVTAERAFDPFFTTKDVGKGTGLGLSMVYGFVKQSGGHLKIYSELGEGTTVKIYLPRHYGAEDLHDEARREDAVLKGSEDETILVCEDDDDVRAYSVETLRELGYRVIEAADGQATLRLLEEGEQVDLLFTDIVLPGGMTGAMVAERARNLRPGLKVLFTTGYARDAIVHHGRLDPGVELLSKPFAHSDLATRIRGLLDS